MIDPPKIHNWDELSEDEKDLYTETYNEWLRARDRDRAKQAGEPPEEDECPHDEHDHGICLDCGADIMDDLIGRAELLEDR